MAVQHFGIIGVGNMGGAIMEGIIRSGAIAANQVTVYDLNPAAIERARGLGANVAGSVEDLVAASDIVMLGVKPKDFLEVLQSTGKLLEGKALLSIIAGVLYADLKDALPDVQFRMLTVLPNTPIQVGEGATGFTKETTFTAEEKQFAQRLFESVGIVEWVPEKLLFAVSALSGGGPAYVAMFVEALGDGGVLQGLPRDIAYRLAAQTVKGTGKMIQETGAHPGAVKDGVTSPGGTTIEAVKELEKGAFRHSVISAVNESAKKFSRLI
jgi:pyrroline-5-carboxylate reductase